jgi:hypothetical protein
MVARSGLLATRSLLLLAARLILARAAPSSPPPPPPSHAAASAACCRPARLAQLPARLLPLLLLQSSRGSASARMLLLLLLPLLPRAAPQPRPWLQPAPLPASRLLPRLALLCWCQGEDEEEPLPPPLPASSRLSASSCCSISSATRCTSRHSRLTSRALPHKGAAAAAAGLLPGLLLEASERSPGPGGLSGGDSSLPGRRQGGAPLALAGASRVAGPAGGWGSCCCCAGCCGGARATRHASL